MWNAWSEPPKIKAQISVSLDGFSAGPDQSVDDPLGIGGMGLHDWAIVLASWREPHGMEGGEVNPSSAVLEEANSNVGAVVMGRNMFGGGPGGWSDGSWKGWWGEDPPFHTPVFVLTHHDREPLEMEGGTTFHFVTDGLDSALDRALEAADGKDVSVGGGAETIRQCLTAGRLDQIWLHTVPILLGSGTRIFDGSEGLPDSLEQVEAVGAPGVIHVKYRIA